MFYYFCIGCHWTWAGKGWWAFENWKTQHGNQTWQWQHMATLPFCMAQSVNLGICLNLQVCPQQIVSNGEHGSILVIQTGSILIEHIWRIFEALKIVSPRQNQRNENPLPSDVHILSCSVLSDTGPSCNHKWQWTIPW